MTTIVQAKYLPMVAPFISAEETRYYLNGVFIEPHHEKGALLVATDGHRMAVIHDAEGECKEAAIWPLDRMLIRWLTASIWDAFAGPGDEDDAGEVSSTPRNLEDMTAHFDGRHVDIIRTGQDGIKDSLEFSAASVAIDGKYPNWRKAIPTPAQLGKTVLGFNPEYVGSFAAVGKSVVFHPCAAADDNSTSRPAIVRCSDVPEFFGLLVLMRFSDIEPFPAWLNPTKEAVA